MLKKRQARVCYYGDEKKGQSEILSREKERNKEHLVALAKVLNLKPLRKA